MCSLRIYLISILLICVLNEIIADQYKIVETYSGEIRGIKKLTFLNKIPFYSFKGIPYAKSPTGDLRFKAPEPAESWSPIIRDAFEHSAICIQPRMYTEPFIKSEDCLTLNIYVPSDDVKPGVKLPVLFFVHGGGYMDGSGDEYFYGPDFIVEKGIILVTINYRLGPLGFLSFNTTDYSGNMGLKDQQVALKWIHLNIAQFGGDNNRITICGQSAGGASVHFHMLSTESRKYFHNAISMSGVVDNHWAWSENNNHLEIAHKMANDFNETKNTTDQLIAFLKTIPAENFNAYSKLITSTQLIDVPFKPVIERSDAIKPFIVECPERIYDRTKFDFDALFTMVSKELLGYLFLFPPLKSLLVDFNFLLPFRGLKTPTNSQEHHNLMGIIRKFYFNNETTENQTINYVDLLSDMNFGYAIDKTVKLHASKSDGKTFYSWFSVDSKLNLNKPNSSELANVSAASHEDELFYLFRRGHAQPILNEIVNNKNDKESKICLQTIDYMTNMISNFVKYGQPSPRNDIFRSFQPVQNGSVHYLDINNDGLEIGLRPKQKAFVFWAYIEQQAREISTNIKKQ